MPTVAAITNATNATPIVIQTPLAHGFATNDLVAVLGVLGNTAANSAAGATWTITVIDATHFSLNGSTGNGTFVLSNAAVALDFGTTAPTPPANPPAGSYGRDLWCVQDLDPGLAEVGGTLVLAQALARRLITPRGRLLDDPNYGFDVTQFLNDDTTPQDVARIASSVDAEFLKDERVLGSQTTINFVATGFTGALTTSTSLTPSTASSFRLVLAVTAVSLTILQPTQ